MNALKKELPDNFSFGVKIYNHSVNLELRNEDGVNIVEKYIEKIPDVNKYLNNGGRLVYGKPSGHVLVNGINDKSRDDFKLHVKSMFEGRLKDISFYKNEDGKMVAKLKFDSKDANDALDKLSNINETDFKAKDSKISLTLDCI